MPHARLQGSWASCKTENQVSLAFANSLACCTDWSIIWFNIGSFVYRQDKVWVRFTTKMKPQHLEKTIFKAGTFSTCSSVSHFLLPETYWEVGVKLSRPLWHQGLRFHISCVSIPMIDGNPISMSLLQWSWENYAFSKIHSPSSAVEGIMTLNLFISLNCQQLLAAIDSLTLQW